MHTVVKVGGSFLEDDALRARALGAIASAFSSGGRLLVVHGGGKRIDQALATLGIPKRTQAGLRVTDPATLEVVVSILAGSVNKALVAELASLGVPAAGVSGADGATLLAERHPPVGGVDLGAVGRVVAVNPALVEAALDAGFLPAVASIALGEDGELFNVNADDAAAALGAALGATRLVFLTDVEGVRDGAGRMVPRLTPGGARALLEAEAATGGMRRKLLASLDAIDAGVPEVVIAGPERHASALENGEGGTRLVAA